ncbi:TPA: hypothetical protein MYK71_001192 [Klebsiella quasipneumoniae subsp. quasipneumoniae]|nr:hypothetical protein [Klebsiella quasipneumoniae subsp. quasipneumoniae]
MNLIRKDATGCLRNKVLKVQGLRLTGWPGEGDEVTRKVGFQAQLNVKSGFDIPVDSMRKRPKSRITFQSMGELSEAGRLFTGAVIRRFELNQSQRAGEGKQNISQRLFSESAFLSDSINIPIEKVC